jgi:FkbM family methyltransferase
MLKSLLKKIINQAGYTLYKDSENPFDAFIQQKNVFGDRQSLTIFDVGANQGQTAAKYKAIFPASTIYAFEPHPGAYTHLAQTAGSLENVRPFQMALGNRDGVTEFFVNTYSETSSLLENTRLGKEVWGEGAMTPAGSIQVQIATLDTFLKTHPVPVIDILKLDTQGTEYQIIEGAAQTLAQRKVKMIYTEIITLPTYQSQKEIHQIMALLHDHAFRLYGVYNHHYTARKLSYVDAIFLINDY